MQNMDEMRAEGQALLKRLEESGMADLELSEAETNGVAEILTRASFVDGKLLAVKPVVLMAAVEAGFVLGRYVERQARVDGQVEQLIRDVEI